MKQLYVFAQQPATTNGTLCPVEAETIQSAVEQAEKVLGAKLQRQGGGNYRDDTGRNFFLYFGEQGLEQLATIIDSFSQGEIQ